jgi:hypothetical protein
MRRYDLGSLIVSRTNTNPTYRIVELAAALPAERSDTSLVLGDSPVDILLFVASHRMSDE